MISDSIFVGTHLHRSKHSNSYNLFLRNKSLNSSDEFSLVKFDDRRLRSVKLMESPFGGRSVVLCSCDGMLLLSGGLLYGTFGLWNIPSYGTLVLWNPSTRMKTELVFPLSYDNRLSYGICHDPTNDDFKVVIMSQSYYAVLSCKNKSWRKRSEFPYSYEIGRINRGSGGVGVDGAVYWVLRHRHNNVREIVYFDPRDDRLKMLKKPRNVEDGKSIFLVDLSGRLCLYCNKRDETTVEIWTKEKGIDNSSWKELITIENVYLTSLWFQPQCCVGNKILVRIECSGFVVYSPCEKRFGQVDEDSSVFNCGRRLVPYMDSLFFPPLKGP